jgi:chromosome segregation ATPase
MTERLDRIEASLQATANICGSNARAIQANGEQLGELRNTVEAFIQKLDDEGLRVTLVTQMADDMGGDVSYLESEKNRQDASIVALREDAIADRAEFRTQAEADRQAFREALETDRTRADADRQRSDQRFDAQLAEIRAQGEQIRALLSALARTNGRVDGLEQAS